MTEYDRTVNLLKMPLGVNMREVELMVAETSNEDPGILEMPVIPHFEPPSKLTHMLLHGNLDGWKPKGEMHKLDTKNRNV